MFAVALERMIVIVRHNSHMLSTIPLLAIPTRLAVRLNMRWSHAMVSICVIVYMYVYMYIFYGLRNACIPPQCLLLSID